MRPALLALLILTGCGADAQPPSPAPTPVESPTSSPDDPEVPEAIRKAIEPLPPAPKLAPANEHKPLSPAGDLLLELRPATKPGGKPEAIRVLLQAEVCLREGQLEVFLCRNRTKEHEAILRTPVDAQLIHAALIVAGGKPGKPVQFLDPKTGEESYAPASGSPIKVGVHYRRAGQLHTHPAQDWVTDLKAKKPMAEGWVFGGSRLVENLDDPKKPPYYAANGGDVIGISNFPGSMLDLPVKVSADNAELAFAANTALIPPLLSKVWVTLEAGR